jgi:hypothetical protein
VATDRAQELEHLPRRPAGLQGVLRRATPISRLERQTRTRLGRSAKRLGARLDSKLRTAGLLPEIARNAAAWRERRGMKGPIGRGGHPLGEEAFDDLSRVFITEGLKAFARLIRTDVTDWGLDVEAILEDEYLTMYNAGGRGAQVKLGIRPNFQLRNRFILERLAERANMLSGGFSDELFDRLRTVLAEEFYIAGNGPLDVARSLQQEFSSFSKTRARLIARTETLTITEQANQTVYEASGVGVKRWLTTLDGKERFSHFGAHGQLRAIDEPFDLVDENGEHHTLMHPGDPDGDLSEICNCRCTTVPVVSEGQLLSQDAVWRGDIDPDEFSRERVEERERLAEREAILEAEGVGR